MARSVLVATPAHDGRVDAAYCVSLVATARLLERHGIEMKETFLINCALIQDIRNTAVRLALDGSFDDLLFIDSDQDWHPGWVMRLLAHPVDCVGIPVRKRVDEEMYNVVGDSFDLMADQVTGLIEVKAVGTGFLRLSRRALRLLWENSERYRMAGEPECRWIFDLRPVNGELMGEDTALCLKLAQHGINTYVDASMTCGHVGRKMYRGDFAAWLTRMQQAQKANAA